jgi:hypothetical protein
MFKLAESVDGRLEVKRWDEFDETTAPKDKEIFWRQVVDTTKNPPKFSVSLAAFPLLCKSKRPIADDVTKTLRKYCVCNEPCNPDRPMIQCDAPTCGTWLHQECILEDMEVRMQELETGAINGKSEKADGIKTRLDSKSMKLVCTGPRNGLELDTWEEDVRCLKCKDRIG